MEYSPKRRLALDYAGAFPSKGAAYVRAEQGCRAPNGLGIFRLSDGKVTSAHFAWNKYLVLQQIGALPLSASDAAV
jgi:hypothetical protein